MAETIILPDGCGNKLSITFDKNNIHIHDSYKVKTTESMRFVLQLVKCAAVNRGIVYKRMMKSWLREWKAHNVLYKLNIRRSSTQHTDLYENESGKCCFAYFILSLFYWK